MNMETPLHSTCRLTSLFALKLMAWRCDLAQVALLGWDTIQLTAVALLVATGQCSKPVIAHLFVASPRMLAGHASLRACALRHT